MPTPPESRSREGSCQNRPPAIPAPSPHAQSHQQCSGESLRVVGVEGAGGVCVCVCGTVRCNTVTPQQPAEAARESGIIVPHSKCPDCELRGTPCTPPPLHQRNDCESRPSKKRGGRDQNYQEAKEHRRNSQKFENNIHKKEDKHSEGGRWQHHSLNLKRTTKHSKAVITLALHYKKIQP